MQQINNFDILTSPWIPVIYKDGSIRETGLNECLEDAGKIRTISSALPYEKIAILRFMAAFVSDAYQLANRRDREQLYERNAFDVGIIEDYVKKCKLDFGASFNLFDKDRPFMTFPFDPVIDTDEVKLSAAYIHINLPHGNNPIHIVNQLEEDFKGDTPAEFLRALLAFYLYPTGNMLKGANTKTGANCYVTGLDKTEEPVFDKSYGSMGVNGGVSCSRSVPVFFWPECDSLFHSVVMCMKSVKELGNLGLSTPPAPWNTAGKPDAKKGKRGDMVDRVSYVSALTFQSRRVVPIVENNLIRECYISNGYAYSDESLWHDPFAVRLRNHKTEQLYNMQADMSRAMWRNIGNLTASSEHDWHIMPDVLKPIRKYSGQVLYEDIQALGMVPKTQNAGYDGMIFDSMAGIPEYFMENEELGRYLKSRIEILEEVAKCWDNLKISKLLNSQDKNAGKFKNEALDNYWNRMHYLIFSEEYNFLGKIIELYGKSPEDYENQLDAILFDYMGRVFAEICGLVIKEANSWNMIKRLTVQTEACLMDYRKIKNKYVGGTGGNRT